MMITSFERVNRLATGVVSHLPWFLDLINCTSCVLSAVSVRARSIAVPRYAIRGTPLSLIPSSTHLPRGWCPHPVSATIRVRVGGF